VRVGLVHRDEVVALLGPGVAVLRGERGDVGLRGRIALLRLVDAALELRLDVADREKLALLVVDGDFEELLAAT
jgi:hypothetical protein